MTQGIPVDHASACTTVNSYQQYNPMEKTLKVRRKKTLGMVGVASEN